MGFSTWSARAWGVFMLFMIPVGGGIPAGVLLAKSRGIGWGGMSALYFVSDWVLALIFEPLLKLLIAFGRKAPRLGRFVDRFRDSMKKVGARYGGAAGPVALVLVAFG